MEYKILTNENEFLAEKESWNAICNSMPNATPFQSWEWNYYWWKNNELVDNLFLIKAFDGKEIFGYAPLIIKEGVAEFIGGRHMDYGGFIVAFRPMIVLEGFLGLLLERGYGLALQEIPSRSSQFHMIQRLLEKKRRYILHKTTRTVYVDLPRYDGLEAYVKLLSQNMRRRTIKLGLKKNLNIEIEPVTDELLQEIAEIYENRQDARGGKLDITWSFPIIRELNAKGIAEVYMARSNNVAIGFLVALKYCNKKYAWLMAFKLEYKDFVPGQLLHYSVLKDGFENGYCLVDFMRGDYDFKLRWECALDTNYTVYVCRDFLSYWRKKIFFAIKPVAKKIVYGNPLLERIYRRRGK